MSNNERTLGFVMAGGNGNRLKILTKHRCKPALEILGSYKIFDFAASNIVNAGIPSSLVAMQYKPESLCEHIKDKWSNTFEIVNPNERGCGIPKFDGTADSVRKSIDRIEKYDPDTVLVLGADHIYFMNYKDAITYHNDNDADITIMTNAIPDDKVSDFGIIKVDDRGRIIDFAEKPTDQEVIDSFRLSAGMKSRLCIEDPNTNFLASMGNYVFHWDRLKKFLDFPGVDFGKDIIPSIKNNGGVLYAYVFNGYWRDVGKIQDYFDCSMNLAQKPKSLLESWIGTKEEPLPPPQISGNSFIKRTILSPGDVVSPKNSIVNSVLGHRIVIEEECAINHCILLGSDKNDVTDKDEHATHIGRGSILNFVILDKNVRIGRRVNISPHNGTPEKRKEILLSIGLKPYRELDDGTIEGDFYIEPETGILVIGEQQNVDPQKLALPDGLVC